MPLNMVYLIFGFFGLTRVEAHVAGLLEFLPPFCLPVVCAVLPVVLLIRETQFLGLQVRSPVAVPLPTMNRDSALLSS